MEPLFSVTSVKIVNGDVYAAQVKVSSCTIFRLSGESMESIASLSGRSCLILWGSSEGLLISADGSLYLVSGGDIKLLLKASRPGNWFWHACEGGGRLYVQEYGDRPTGIYVSDD